jgi:glyoxylase-like metal-dependent hydrolase (beta-lactamase superfamily II)
MKGAFNNVRRVFAQMPADMLVRFEPGAEVAPGIRSVAAFGHTPGHTLFDLRAAGQNFVYVGDLTNVPALFARNPDWAVTFDMDAEARARRAARPSSASSPATPWSAASTSRSLPWAAWRRGTGYAFQPLAGNA